MKRYAHIAVAVTVLALGSNRARGAVDLTGNWGGVGFADVVEFPVRFAIVQTGNTFTVSFPETASPVYSGVLDPDSGALTFGGRATCAFDEFDSFAGFVSPDGTTISAGGTLHLNFTPTICGATSASFSLTRLPCGDGVLDPDEDCDDGNLFGNDCCSFGCHREPNDKVCDDGDPTTANTVCLNVTCVLPGLCGNDVPDPGEECDDGDPDGIDCCSSTCTIQSDGTLCTNASADHYDVCVASACTSPGDIDETQINEFISGNQISPAVSCDAVGRFVVGWNDDTLTVRARRFDEAIDAVGEEARDILVARELFPRVASDAAGNFVMTWTAPDGSNFQVLAHRFDDSGGALGPRFRISSETVRARLPDVASDSDGNFVVVWQQREQVSNGPFTVTARRYDRDGAALGSEITVSDSGARASAPRVALDGARNFVVAWQEGPYAIKARRFTSSGIADGPIVPVSLAAQAPGYQPRISASVAGTFIVGWSTDDGFRARRYSSAGTPLGTDIEISGMRGDVAMDAAGSFVVVDTPSDGFGRGIRAQRFDSNGAPLGGPFPVNGFTFNDQAAPSVCAAPGGDFVIAWESAQQDGSGSGIFARRFEVDQVTPTPVPAACAGDSNRDGGVSVSEVVTGVNITLGETAVDECRSLDHNASGQVTVDELVAAVRTLLNGC